MKHFQHFLLWVFAAVFCTGASAQHATPSAAHLAAAQRVVYAMGLPERFIIPTKQLLQRSLDKDPVNAPLMSATMAPYLKKSYTANQLKGYFASQFDLETCRQIAAFWEGPVGKKLVRTQVTMLNTGDAPELVFTSAEKAIIQRFEATPAAQAFQVAMPGIEDRLAEYTKNTQMKMREDFLTELHKRSAQKPASGKRNKSSAAGGQA